MSSQSFFVLQNKVLVKQKSTNIYILMLQKLRGKDLNQRPPGYEPDELPDCSTPRYSIKYKCQKETNYLVSLRGVDQIWTGDEGVADLCLTTWLRRHNMTPTGFEPMLPPWKGGVLTTWPTGHKTIKRRVRDSNPRRRSLPPYMISNHAPSASRTTLHPRTPAGGLEPSTAWLTVRCSTNWAMPE